MTLMNAREQAAAERAAAGQTAPTARTAGPVPMGIRYRTPARPAAPTAPRPRWAELAAATLLPSELAHRTPAQPAPANAARRTALPAARTVARPRRGDATTPQHPPTVAPVPPPAAAPAEPAPARPAPARTARRPRRDGPTPPPAAVRVLGSYEAYACEACGSRYHLNHRDHECGRLTPVTVTITTRPGGGERA